MNPNPTQETARQDQPRITGLSPLLHTSALLIVLAGLVACATAKLPPHAQDPFLLEKMDARIGIYYTPRFRSMRTSHPLFDANAGDVSVAWFKQATAAMFAETIELSDEPNWRNRNLPLQGVLEFSAASFDVTSGNDSDVPDQITATYRICLYLPNGSLVNCWLPSASQSYQRELMECLDLRKCLTPLLDSTIREAVSLFTRTAEKDLQSLFPTLSANNGLRHETDVMRTSGTVVGLLWWPADPQKAVEGFYNDTEACLSRHLSVSIAALRLLSQHQIRDILFPLMEPATQPETVEAFAALLARKDVQLRLSEYGLDYLVAFSGGTDIEQQQGAVLCGGGFGAGGCLGFAWRHESTVLNAVLWALSTSEPEKRLRSESRGTSYLPAMIAPIPIPAGTHDDACRILSQYLAEEIH